MMWKYQLNANKDVTERLNTPASKMNMEMKKSREKRKKKNTEE